MLKTFRFFFVFKGKFYFYISSLYPFYEVRKAREKYNYCFFLSTVNILGVTGCILEEMTLMRYVRYFLGEIQVINQKCAQVPVSLSTE